MSNPVERRASPNYHIQWGWNFPSGSAKVQAVAYVIRADRRGRITMAGFMPALASNGGLYGFIGRMSGESTLVTGTNGAATYQYENDAAVEAGKVQATPDLSLGSVLDGIFKDGTVVGLTMPSTSGGAAIQMALPFTLLSVGGPEMGPLAGKDAVVIEPGDIIAIVVLTTTAGSGAFQAEITARPVVEGQ